MEEEITNSILFHNPLLVLSPDKKIQFNKYSFIENQKQSNKKINLNKTDEGSLKYNHRSKSKSKEKNQYIRYHNGVFKSNQSLGTEAWSCCLQTAIDAKVYLTRAVFL